MVQASSRRIYIFLLSLAFLYAIIMSYLHIKSDSTFEESIEYNQGTLPSITFCPIEPNKLHFQTFEDIVQAINELKSRILASINFFDGRKVNLINETAEDDSL